MAAHAAPRGPASFATAARRARPPQDEGFLCSTNRNHCVDELAQRFLISSHIARFRRVDYAASGRLHPSSSR